MFQDYIHRVGRTARAGRSGKAITFVTQYDVELFQRIEHLIGKKLPVFPTEDDEVMMLTERVTEAQRFARMELREHGEKKKRTREDTGDNDETEGEIVPCSAGLRRCLVTACFSRGNGVGGSHRAQLQVTSSQGNKTIE